MIEKNDIVYLSGPMSGIPDANKPAFDSAEKYLMEEFGCRILNPARHPDGLDYAQYMALAMTDLHDCTKVVTLPGIRNSMGACFEIFIVGQKLLKPVFSLHEIRHRRQLAPTWFHLDD